MQQADDAAVLEVSRLFAKWYIDQTKDNKIDEHKSESNTQTINIANIPNQQNITPDNEPHEKSNIEKKLLQRKQILKLASKAKKMNGNNERNTTNINLTTNSNNNSNCFDFSQLLGMVNDLEKKQLKDLNEKLDNASKIIDNAQKQQKKRKKKKKKKKKTNKNTNEIDTNTNNKTNRISRLV